MATRGPGPRGGNSRFAQFKLVLLGESAVGKSSLVLRFVKDQFDSYRESTIGAAFLTQTISLDDTTTVKFEIWDTAGQERYKSLAPMYYRNANCAVVVYDITQASSLDKAKQWVKELQRQANENIIIALAGNKLDLVDGEGQEGNRAIAYADAEAYANEADLLFFETSAKTPTNVSELFTAIAKKLPLDQAGQRGGRSGVRPGVTLTPESPNTAGAGQSRAGRQWHAATPDGRVGLGGMRGYADTKKPSISDSKPVVLPGSSSAGTSVPAPQGSVATTSSSKLATSATPVTPADSTIPPQNVPLTPPPPGKIQTTPTPSTSSTPPPLTSTPKPPRKFFRKFFTTLFLLTTLGFGGGVYYSRVNDNFHDFFTEYVPFGEEAVLYLEEKEFRKRFPSIANRSGTRPKDTGEQVKIPSQSGVSWKVADDKSGSNGRYANATKPETSKTKEAIQTHSEAKPTEKSKAVENAKKEADHPAPKAPEPKPATKTIAKPVTKKSDSKNETFKAPEVDEPSKFAPTIGKAKEELVKIGTKINDLKDEAQREADKKIKQTEREFDAAALELKKYNETQINTNVAAFREEYATEMQRIRETFEQKLKAEVEREKEVNEERLRNGLLEQAIEMKRRFIADVKDRVEEERSGRLGKLSDLSNTVNELEKLTTDWNSVVDANLKTQHLHVAVEAVRSNLEKSQVPRPFTKELAALKEIAADDPVVNAAIASINPTAYQRGVPSSAQLIDRFRRVATEVRKASLLPEEAGVASHASSYILSKLLFKKKGLATGNDVESILTRTETFLEEGDLDNAAREMNGLNGWAKTLSRDWLGEVRKVLEVQQALDTLIEIALTLLDQLQSNRSITSIVSSTPRDMNAAAIPEMLEWARKAGFAATDFAKLKCIHVAGTKGKGSVCAMVENILKQYQGRGLGKIGMYTSPHLVTVRERIRIDGVPISEQAFTRGFYELWDRFAAFSSNGDASSRPGYFRYLTLLAFHTFLKEGVETAIIECGLGGEYDSTNILPQDAVSVSAITSLGIDHVGMLGDTIKQIAWHKGGIMKKGVPAFTTEQDAAAQTVLEQRAVEKETALSIISRLPLFETEQVNLGLEGSYQISNASLAIAVSLSHLQKLGIIPVPSAPFTALSKPFLTGLETVSWPGRCQVIQDGNIAWHLDGAHTIESIRATASWFDSKLLQSEALAHRYTATMLIFNQAERDFQPLLATLVNNLRDLRDLVRPELLGGQIPRDLEWHTRKRGRVFRYAAFCDNTPFKTKSRVRDEEQRNSRASKKDKEENELSNLSSSTPESSEEPLSQYHEMRPSNHSQASRYLASDQKRPFRSKSKIGNKEYGDGEVRWRSSLKLQEQEAKLYEILDGNTLHMCYGSIEEAMQLARKVAMGEGERVFVLVTGSLHLVGGVLTVLEREGQSHVAAGVGV
ncbi:hypothetical protein B7494_g4014 [Chlorociboria aeruginascens]|nr:hypothetical protein B7494_g4014 [Chlorociboria aeruginascens]